MTVDRPHLAAVVSSLTAPLLFVGAIVLAPLAYSGYDPVRLTISDLAAGDSPVAVPITIVFILSGLCHLVTAAFGRGIGAPGRAALALGGILSLGIAAFPVPTVETVSEVHRVIAALGFVVFTVWPVLGARRSRSAPWIIRPAGAVLGTIVMAAMSLWFLVVWATPELGYIGVVERLSAIVQSLWPALVVLALRRSSRAARASDILE